MISQPIFRFLGVIFNGDHDFEGNRSPKAHLDTVLRKPVTPPDHPPYARACPREKRERHLVHNHQVHNARGHHAPPRRTGHERSWARPGGCGGGVAPTSDCRLRLASLAAIRLRLSDGGDRATGDKAACCGGGECGGAGWGGSGSSGSSGCAGVGMAGGLSVARAGCPGSRLCDASRARYLPCGAGAVAWVAAVSSYAHYGQTDYGYTDYGYAYYGYYYYLLWPPVACRGGGVQRVAGRRGAAISGGSTARGGGRPVT